MKSKNANPPIRPDAQARASDEGQNGAHAQILQFLQKLHFRRVLFGGLDEQSVWQALWKLNAGYEAALQEAQLRYEAQLQLALRLGTQPSAAAETEAGHAG